MSGGRGDRADRLALLDLLLEQEGIAGAVRPTIPRRAPGPPPLSFGQQRLLFLDRFAPGNPTYNVNGAFRLGGALAPAALAAALGEIARRHEALRTTFALDDGVPVATIRDPEPVALPLVDLSGLPADRREGMRAAVVGRRARRPFDLERGPLLGALLVRLGPREHALLVSVHHIAADGWSLGNLARELVELYGAALERRPSPLAELPIQYADYAAWQRARAATPEFAAQVAAWRDRLAGAPPILDLPTDRPRPALAGSAGGAVPVRIATELGARLADLGRGEKATSFMVLLAAFGALLARHGGGEDVVVGTPLANRSLPETEPLIGFFVNMVPLRLDLAGAPSFRTLLRRTQAEALAAFDRQEVPFERLVEELDLARDAAATPVFQVAFALQNTPDPRFERPDLEIAALPAETGSAKFDLLLGLREGRGGVGGSLEFRSELFDAATMVRWVDRLNVLLAGAADAPDARLSELPVLTAAERAELLAPPSSVEAPAESLPAAFARVARAQPDAVAVSADGSALTYGELARRAAALADRLAALGVGAEDRVALAVPRTLDLAVGIVGIVRAGAAYVPIDPSYPEARLRYLIADSAARALVATRSVLADLPEGAGGAGLATLVLDELGAPDAAGGPAAAFDRFPEPAADAAAYVIYTSGSTGRPKGVVVSHGNVRRLFGATAHWFTPDARDVWSLFHSFAFDFSVWELWGALLHGGRVAVVPWLTSRSPEAFRALLAEEQVTHLSQTPSAFRTLIRADLVAGEPLAALRTVVFGGEALELQALAPWFERYDDRRPTLVNLYGITETTVHVTVRPVGRRDLARAGASPIGVAIPDLALRVLDRTGALAPPGVPGELAVGGAGVARGYLGRPELTAERFVPDPCAAAPGARLYRSGDLGRRRLDGDHEYLGRIDHQVKIRGFRIELGEIEAALAEHPDLAESAVVARGDDGETRLVAYVVARGAPAPAADQLRHHLRLRLPEHMLPAAFVELPALPTTAHGKVDRGALPAPGGARPDLANAYAPPRDEVERHLAEVWAAVVGVERVGIHDNYFALGGDSIRSLRVLALCRRRGLEPTLQDLFRHQTIAELAAALRAVEAVGPDPAPAVESRPFDLVTAADRALLPADVEDAYPLAFLQAGMLYHLDQSPESPAYHNVDSIHLRAPFDLERFREAVDAVVARHPILRTSFHLTGYSEPLQLVHRTATLAIESDDLRGLADAEQAAWIAGRIRAEHVRLFDPTKAPLLRFHLARRSDETLQFTLTENHAIFDGWSLHATLRELFDRYLARVAGERPEALPPPAVPYREFVRLEREAIRSSAPRAFWRAWLEGSEGGALPRLPGYPRTGQGHRMRTLSWLVPEDLVEDLRRAALEVGAPLKSALLAAHARVLGVVAGRDDVLTGLASNGRPEVPGGEETRGLFLNMVPLRLALAGGSWRDLVRAAFEAEAATLPHRRFPMGLIQKERGDRALLESAFTYIYFHSVEELVHSGRIEVLAFERAEQTHFPLATTFTISPVTSRLTLLVDCDAQELADEQIAPVLGLFERALTAIARTPAARHDAHCLLLPSEVEQLLARSPIEDFAALGGTARLEVLVRRSAVRSPDAVALEDDRGGRMTYRELIARAAEAAERLVAAGAGPERAVGICLDRSLEMAVAILGVLESGAAWLPLDPSLPFDRLAYLVADGAVVALAASPDRRELAARLAACDGAARPVVEIDAVAPVVLDRGGEGALGDPGRDLESAAYAIYTSGSTGRPKGVLVPHGAIANRLLWMARRFPLAAGERVAVKTPFSFDASIWELFLPLLSGGTAVLADPDGHRDTGYLARFVAARRIAVLQLVPSLLGPFLAEPELATPDLRRLFCGGEALPSDLVKRCRERLPGVELHNLYGPTEAAIDAASNSDLDALATATAPIGRSIANLRLAVVDPFGQPSPTGVPGELLIAGRGLARGYLGRADLTAERFVPDPWGGEAGEPGARAYRTGDLARRLPDGALEFLGRLDRQAKLRGYRIELEEVEAALGRHPEVRAAAVAIHGETPESRRLVAYVVAQAGAAPSPADLQAFLAERLPEPMLPSAYVALAELPRTPGGKLDRRALPAPAAEAEEAAETARARTAVEEIVAAVAAEVLEIGAETAGGGLDLDRSFLAHGGHSLQAIQLALRLRQTFKTELRVRHVLQAESLRALAATLERHRSAGVGAAEEPLLPVPRDGGPLPLSFAQRSLWVLHQLDPGSAVFHIPMAVRLRGPLDRARLARAFDVLIDRHETLRTVFRVDAASDEPMQVILAPESLAIRVVDLSDLEAEARAAAVRREIAADHRAPFDLERGPLVRVSLLALGAAEHVAVLTLHHIVSDGWSTGVLMRELGAVYAALGAGEPHDLPPLPIQYADFAAWQRARLAGDGLERQVGYWRERLAGAPPVLDLPGDRERPPARSGRGGVRARQFPAPLAAGVDALARATAATPFMVYLGAFAILLGELSGRDDLVVGTDVACRNRLETEGLIGFFVNQLALRLSLADDSTFRELIGRVRDEALGAYAHQDLPFEQLVSALRPERTSAYPPLFQVKLNLQNLPAARASAREAPTDLEIQAMAFERSVAELDFTVNLVESPAGVLASAEFNSDLFDAPRIAGWLASYEALVDAATADANATVGALAAVVREAERRRREEAAAGLAGARQSLFRSVRRTPAGGGA